MRYANDIVVAIDTIRTYLQQPTSDDEIQKQILLDAVDRQLTIVAEAAGNLSRELQALRPDIDWVAISGFRRRLVHQYWAYSREIAASVVETRLEPLRIAMGDELAKVQREATEATQAADEDST